MTPEPIGQREELVDVFLSIDPMRGHTRAHVEAALARVSRPDFRKATSAAAASEARGDYVRAVNAAVAEELARNKARVWDLPEDEEVLSWHLLDWLFWHKNLPKSVAWHDRVRKALALFPHKPTGPRPDSMTDEEWIQALDLWRERFAQAVERQP
jgi:hypothetical protein